ncbi:helix-turn-helix domain-containing protein [Vibrio viridaestus]|uniref:AraC family transcriptional regulator n=1 Tax=Vibrio viridaestus TaxID=2487322 RepID=A0A3N9U3V2_9VIBR|nr:helix-turn-helix domain-containing protein [Vibrio viridaestus]RQW64262.1 AraC family transcriptional regulator [Vibrio viridaestus]
MKKVEVSKRVLTGLSNEDCSKSKPSKLHQEGSRCFHMKGIDLFYLDVRPSKLEYDFGENVVNLFLINEGGGYFENKQRVNIFSKNDLVVFKPSENLNVYFDKSSKVFVYSFCMSYFNNLESVEFYKCSNEEFESDIFNKILTSISNVLFNEFCDLDEFKVKMLFEHFLSYLKSTIMYSSNNINKFDCLDKIKSEIYSKIEDQDLNIEKICSMCNISPKTLNRLFSLESMTVMKWVITKRLEKSYDLILSDIYTPISTVAFLCGFKDSSHFSRAFKKQYGQPPMEIRNSLKNSLLESYK